MSKNSLEGKTVIITGAAGGIGSAAADLFTTAGAHVFGWDLRFDSEKIGEWTPVETNITDPKAVEKALQMVLAATGRVDVLINNAGITRDARLEKMSAVQWQEVLDVNLTGVFNCTKAVIPVMIDQKSGNIINTSSVVAHYGNYGQSNYVASKSAVIGLTKVWARELGMHGIRVNAVAPGFIATEMLKTVPGKVIDKMLERSCLKKTGSPQDIARAYLWLASEESSFITAHVLNVDGGLVI